MMVNFIPVKAVQNISEQISFHNIMLYLDYYQNIFIKKSYNNMVSQLIYNHFFFFYSTMHYLPFSILIWGPSWPWSYGSWIYNYQCNRCLSSHMLWVRLPLRVRCTTLFDKVCQWLVAGRWFSPGPPFFLHQ